MFKNIVKISVLVFILGFILAITPPAIIGKILFFVFLLILAAMCISPVFIDTVNDYSLKENNRSERRKKK